MDSTITKQQVDEIFKKQEELGIHTHLDVIGSHVQISDIVHIIGNKDMIDLLLIKCGKTIVDPVPCFYSSLYYLVVPIFPKKNFSLAWTDSMDVYVVGMLMFLNIFSYLLVLKKSLPTIKFAECLKDGKEGWQIMCRNKEMCTFGFRSSWLHFKNLNWDDIRNTFSQIIGYYTSPRIYTLKRTVRGDEESDFEITYVLDFYSSLS